MRSGSSLAVTSKFGRQRSALLDAIEEEEGYDSDAKAATKCRQTVWSCPSRSVHPKFVLYRSGSSDHHDTNHRVMRQVVDAVTQGLSIVLFEICRGVLVVVVVGSVATAAVCVGVYVHMNQWQLVV
ncbi:hypothetical protein AaE_003947 [Aphanomyces astaci]|uniref:Uncharacterized protein n=1 Tax=Aphanomyces astaci TaxID=112090 RepID=A0A6A5AJP4_APHAT|nr:hypothetical protein AaE_003947 [Aphanomyces astaci]